jgi:hypothetical protein
MNETEPLNDSRPCCYRWHASRVEADTAPVEHVCARGAGHQGFHICSCTAYAPPEGAPVFRLQVE